MIDWSNSDYVSIDSNMYYTSEVDRGVYLNRNDDISEHYCYECTDKTKSTRSTEPIPLRDTFVGNNESFKKKPEIKYVPVQNIPLQNIPVHSSMVNPIIRRPHVFNIGYPMVYTDNFQPVSNFNSKKSNFLNSIPNDTVIIFLFILVVVFMVITEIRLSTMYINLNNCCNK